MQVIYEATVRVFESKDFDDGASAIAFVEAAGAGRVVKFVRDFTGRDRSCAMQRYEDGQWIGIDISR